MNKSNQIRYKGLILLFVLFGAGVYAQKQSKTFKETFSVGPEALININTSYADIEFETWDKPQVVIEAIVELEGATEEEASEYFEKGEPVQIFGNSKTIEVRTGRENSWSFGDDFDFSWNDWNNNLVIEIPELPEVEPLFLDLEIPELPELMEMPVIPFIQFDYDEYKKDGEKYMKKWKEEHSELFDEDFKARMKEWAELMEERSRVWKERKKEHKEARKKLIEERNRLKAEAREARDKAREERDRLRTERDVRRNIVISRSGANTPNFIYRWSDEAKKKYKVKKTIRIKMPKSARLKMNVRHGEVKLAENVQNIDATLSYARLLASSISGDKTNIIASYSPVSVQNWNYGSLKADFSEKINLKEVKDLVLYSNSSDVTIEKLINSANIKNNLGVVQINSVGNNFKDMDISVQYGEFFCDLPSTAYSIYVNGTSSKLKSPAYLVLDRSTNHDKVVHKGFHLKNDTGKSIVINSEYSKVVLEE